MYYIDIIKDKLDMYYGDYIFLIITIVACVFLAIEDKETRKKLIYPLLLVVLCIVCPVLYKYVFKNIIYWRLFWLIPSSLLVPTAIVKLIKRAKSNILQYIILVVFICIIVNSGVNVYDNVEYLTAKNGYKISQATVDVCEIILSKDSEPKCIMPNSIYTEVRQYSGDIQLMYGRNMQGYISESSVDDDDIYKKMSDSNPQYETVLALAQYEGYNFVVNDINKPINQILLDRYGFCEIGRTEYYIVYQAISDMSDEWLVAQIGMNGNWENTGYVLKNQNNRLIIIDGGREGNGEYLYNLIKENNYHVDAWIITTPLREHVGAFNKIMSEYDDVTIDKIYTIDVNYERYSEFAKEYEYIEYYEIFKGLTDNMDNIVFVNEGEIIDLCGLEMEVINAWDEQTDLEKTVLAQRGAMVFSLKNKEEAILFCSDALGVAEEKINDKLKNINYDYVQIDNHGKYALSSDVYNSISAKAVFVDITVSRTSEDKRAVVYDLMTIFNEKDITVYTLDTSSNMIILK